MCEHSSDSGCVNNYRIFRFLSKQNRTQQIIDPNVKTNNTQKKKHKKQKNECKSNGYSRYTRPHTDWKFRKPSQTVI